MAVFVSRELVVPEIVPPVNFVEYIESTGTQYIDTGVVPNETTVTRIKVNMTEVSSGVIVGNQPGNDNGDYRLFNHQGKIYFDVMASRLIGNDNSFVVGTLYDFEFGNNYVKNYGYASNLVSGNILSAFTSGSTIKLFYHEGAKVYSNGKCYLLQIWNNNTLVRDYRPCYDPDGVACLYDMVNKEYVYNAGTGDFIAGGAV